jgi:hypothetical protein
MASTGFCSLAANLLRKKWARSGMSSLLPAGAEGTGNDVEPVVKVLPEGAFGDHVFEVAVGGCEDTDVDGVFPCAADTAHLAVLQHP